MQDESGRGVGGGKRVIDHEASLLDYSSVSNRPFLTQRSRPWLWQSCRFSRSFSPLCACCRTEPGTELWMLHQEEQILLNLLENWMSFNQVSDFKVTSIRDTEAIKLMRKDKTIVGRFANCHTQSEQSMLCITSSSCSNCILSAFSDCMC